MSEPKFFGNPTAVSLQQIASWADAEIVRGDEDLEITAVAPLEEAGAGALVFFDNTAYLAQLEATGAAACLVGKRHQKKGA